MERFRSKLKFGNKRMSTPDGEFDSKGEWQRWLFLRDAERRGEIKDLERQVKFTLIPNQYKTEIVHLKTKDKEVTRIAEREVTYTADFVYKKRANSVDTALGPVERWTRVVEDYKGMRTDKYLIKRKIMLYMHGISIREVERPTEEI